MMAAVALKEELLQISDSEADALGDALAEIADEYGVSASKRAMLWVNLVSASALIYVPRVKMIAQKSRQQRASRVTQAAAQGDSVSAAVASAQTGIQWPNA